LSTADRTSYDFRPYVAEERVRMFHPGPEFQRPWGRLSWIMRTVDLLRLWKLGEELAREIDSGGFDVALAQPCQFTQSPPVLRYLATPTVYYCQEPLRCLYEAPIPRPYLHGYPIRRTLDKVDLGLHLYRSLARWNDQRAIRSATRVLVNSVHTQTNVRRIYGVNGTVCYHGVDAERFRPLSQDRDSYLLSVGALVPHKGFDFLIDALARLPSDKRLPLHLICNYAEEQERQYLSNLARERGLVLTIREAVSDGELIEAYNRASVVLYAPYREPFGLVPLEAMACGTPVVAVREGGVQETMIDRQTGILVERDPEEFSRAVRTLLEEEALARQYGSQGRMHVLENWSWEKAVHELETHLLQVAES